VALERVDVGGGVIHHDESRQLLGGRALPRLIEKSLFDGDRLVTGHATLDAPLRGGAAMERCLDSARR
jgi:hypothetical protein